MAGHDTPGINFQAFVLSAIVQACHQRLKIHFPHKHIQPVNHGKTHKIYPLLSAHAKIGA